MPTTTVPLYIFNTIALTANVPVRLVGRESGNYGVSVLNLGPGTIYLRADQDPTVGDPRAEKLPATMYDNAIPFDGKLGLGVIADATGAITVRRSP